MEGKQKIKARQIRQALVRIGSQLEGPWPGKDGRGKYAIFLRQAVEALESAEKEVDDDTILYYSGHGDEKEVAPQPIAMGKKKGGPPPDCDADMWLFVMA